jgi:hypothetical protein
LKIIERKIVENNKIDKFLLQLDKNVVISSFGEVEDMVESIFESMP